MDEEVQDQDEVQRAEGDQKVSDVVYRCPIVNPWDWHDRCSLAENDPHEDGHKGQLKGRTIFYDTSAVEVDIETPERWEVFSE